MKLSLPWRSRRLFISYSREHEKDISSLVDVLSATQPVFFDTRSLRFGDNWREQVADAIRRSGKLFLFWCSHSKKSEPIAFELQTALRHHLQIFPLMLDDTPLPSAISELHAITSTKGLCASFEFEPLDPMGADDGIEHRRRMTMFPPPVNYYKGGAKFRNEERRRRQENARRAAIEELRKHMS